MEITRKIIKLGNSKAITLPKEISKRVRIGEKVIFDLEYLDTEEPKITEYKCLACEHIFCSDDDIIHCPACDCGQIEEYFENLSESIIVKGGKEEKW